MDPSTVAFIKAVVSFALLAGTGLTAYWLRSRVRATRAASQLPEEVDRLNVELQDLRRLLETELPDVQERLNFVERHIARLPLPPRQDRPEPTPV